MHLAKVAGTSCAYRGNLTHILCRSLSAIFLVIAMVLAVSALSTTGPLAEVAAETSISFAGLPDLAKVILAFAMVLGRLETLSIIALFNPEIWRN